MIESARSQIRYGPPDPGKKARHRPPKGRSCQQPGCATVLSTYNAADHCFIHSAPAFRHPLYRV
jgi:hypothetical protein